jgi:hypothetical protein
MTDLANTDVTYSFSILNKHFVGKAGYVSRGTLTFGNGSLTYPTGGIPLIKQKMHMPRTIKALKVLETNAKNVICEYDVSTEKLRLFKASTPTGNCSAPTLTITDAAGNATLNLALSADANSATINNNNIAATLALTGVVSAPTFTGDAATFAEWTTGGVTSSIVCEVEVRGY